jgi:hypothetical protein
MLKVFLLERTGHSGSKGMTIMFSILVVVIVGTLFYCVYCWRWRKRNGELLLRSP